ncbi:MAG: cobamide remodeling phosphodiesterase CbiR [Chloroflexota bacterium]
MRFGIMSMQLGLILPRDASASPDALRGQVAAFDIAGLVGRLAEAGFQTIELNTELERFLPGCYDDAAIARLAALKAQRGLTYTVHLPLWAVEPSTSDPNVRAASVATLVDAIKRTQSLAPEVYVLHNTGAFAAEVARMTLPEVARQVVLGGFREQARISLSEILARTGIASRRLALENVEFPQTVPLALAEEFDCSLCLDTGHLLAGFNGDQPFADGVEWAVPRLAEIHLHDAYRRAGAEGSLAVADHLPLGAGDLPLTWLLDRLEAARFAGPLVLELGVTDALTSLARVKATRPEVV